MCTRLWMTVGSGAMPDPGTGASGNEGGPPSLGLSTVVKQMLYSYKRDQMAIEVVENA